MRDLIEIRSSDENAPPGLDEIAREGARRMLAVALEAEAADYIARHQERDEHGRVPVVRRAGELSRDRRLLLWIGHTS